MRFLLRFLCVVLALTAPARAGVTEYTDPGKTDFDNAMTLLNPYGTWSKIDEKWAYTPLDHGAPYTDGQWRYTENGWHWSGRKPHSWATEHYGYWKRGQDKVWSWYPGPVWLPQTVELRSTATHIGWRSAEVDRDGNFVEAPADRFTKVEEWTFVTRAQFAGPITPQTAVKGDQVESLLEDSSDSHHSYMAYRPLDRVGPHPADFATGTTLGGMFPPLSLEDQLAAQQAAAAGPKLPKAAAKAATNAPASASPDADDAPDPRQVRYWVTMCLPTFWAKPPVEAKPSELYVYRPDFWQDEDGIARRITLWFDPNARYKTALNLANTLSGDRAPEPGTNAAAASPPVPAKPVNAFASPFDNSYHPPRTPNPSSKRTSASTNAPSAETNTVPTGR